MHLLSELFLIEIGDHDLNKEMVYKAKCSMKSRYRYSYSALDFAYNFIMPFECFKKRCRKNVLNIHTRLLLF